MTKPKRRHLMKSLLTGIFAALALCSLSAAQDATPAPTTSPSPQAQQSPMPAQSTPTSPAQAGATSPGAPRSRIPGPLPKSTPAEEGKAGHEIQTKVKQGLQAGNGENNRSEDNKAVRRR